jgi:hypothetical protein
MYILLLVTAEHQSIAAPLTHPDWSGNSEMISETGLQSGIHLHPTRAQLAVAQLKELLHLPR